MHAMVLKQRGAALEWTDLADRQSGPGEIRLNWTADADQARCPRWVINCPQETSVLSPLITQQETFGAPTSERAFAAAPRVLGAHPAAAAAVVGGERASSQCYNGPRVAARSWAAVTRLKSGRLTSNAHWCGWAAFVGWPE